MKQYLFSSLFLFFLVACNTQCSSDKKDHQLTKESTRRVRPVDSRKIRKHPNGTTLLHLESKSGNTERVTELLKSKTVDPNARNEHGYTPLHYVAGGLGNGEIAKLLIAHGANPNVRSKNGRSLPLFDAIDFAKPDVVRALIEGGADLRLESGHGRSETGEAPALVYAKGRKKAGYGNPKDMQEIIDILEEASKKETL